MNRKFFLLFAVNLICFNLYSDIDDYFYYQVKNSSSSLGDTGLIELPSAKFMEEGSLRLTFSSSYPNEYTALTATPFQWLEATYRYTEMKNNLYGPAAFSGNQTAKDKSFDIKIRLSKEGLYSPDFAIGLRDFAGTGAFSSEYLVFTKTFGNAHITSGIGWGVLGTAGGYKNSLDFISSNFNTRISSTGQGGDFNSKDWFSGEAAIFGGLEYDLKKYGLKFKLEYDTSEPDQREYPVDVDSRFNLGLEFFVTDSLNLGLAFERGNQFRLSFTLTGNFSEDTISKNRPRNVVKLNTEQQERARKDNRIFYRSLNKSLQDEKLYVQAASLKSKSVSISVGSSNLRSFPRMAGRTARIASALAPDEVEEITIHLMNGAIEAAVIEIDRSEFDKVLEKNSSPSELLYKTKVYSSTDKPLLYSANFKPEIDFPEFAWTVSPALKHQIGGPEGFYLGQLWLKTDTTVKFSRNLSLYTSIGLDIYNNFDQLNNPSASKVPHVRSDIQDYLKEGRNNIQRMKLEYLYSPYNDWFVRADLGLLEEMFGGIGGEVLYRPFNKKWALGLSLHKVKQREYRQRLGFRDYETETGFLEIYYDLPERVSTSILIGKYLAGDKGVTFDLSKRFKTGFALGVFATKTSLSKEEFGEGSFDKGFYFSIPTELFYTDYRAGNISFGLHPLTKDGGAIMYQHNSLFSILGGSNRKEIIDYWDDIDD